MSPLRVGGSISLPYKPMEYMKSGVSGDGVQLRMNIESCCCFAISRGVMDLHTTQVIHAIVTTNHAQKVDFKSERYLVKHPATQLGGAVYMRNDEKKKRNSIIAGKHRRRSITKRARERGCTCGQIAHVVGERVSRVQKTRTATLTSRTQYDRMPRGDKGGTERAAGTSYARSHATKLSQTAVYVGHMRRPKTTLLYPTITGWPLSPRDGRDEACRAGETSFRREQHTRKREGAGWGRE